MNFLYASLPPVRRWLWLVALLTALLALKSQAQTTIVAWNFEASTASPSTANANIAASVSFGSGVGAAQFLTGGNPGISFVSRNPSTSVGWTNSSSRDVNDYLQLEFTPTYGYALDLSQLRFDEGKQDGSGNGPREYVVYCSTDGFATERMMGTVVTIPTGTGWRSRTVDFSDASFDAVGTRLTIRIYGYKSSTLSTGNDWRFDNIQLEGTVRLPLWITSGNNLHNSNTGNVGVGTATPGNKLEVATGTAGQSGLRLTGLAGHNPAAADTVQNGKVLSVAANGDVQLSRLRSSWGFNGNNLFSLGENVGIGTASPLTRLHVVTGVSGASGLRLSGLAGVTPGASDTTRQVLTVNATGDVVLARVSTTTAAPPTGGGSTSWTANGNHLYNANTGNVGVGMTNPEYKLDVQGTINSRNHIFATNDILAAGNVVAGQNVILDGANAWNIHSNDAITTLVFAPRKPDGTWDWDKATEVMADGSMMIKNHLTTLGGVMTNGTMEVGGNLEMRGGDNAWVWHSPDGNGDKNLYLAPLVNNAWDWSNQIVFRNDGSALFSGLGIGTSNLGTNKLAVNGTIQAKEVIVTLNGWSDHVFQPGYRLRPLSELAAYLKLNRHLPNVPSEKEIIENGVPLAQVQSKLLEKIEELTLYVIQQDAQIKRLQREVKGLKGKKR